MKTLSFFALTTLLATAACSAQVAPTSSAAAGEALAGDGGPAAHSDGGVGLACVIAPSGGSANPAAAYCSALGYQADNGQCTFPDGTSCEQFAFYRGECGGTHSFCNTHGGQVSTRTEDMGGWTATYALCALPDGRSCKDEDYAHTCVCNDGFLADAGPAPDAAPGPMPGPTPDAGSMPDGAQSCVALPPSGGSANPAAVYCTALGYSVANGQCDFPDGTSCDEWAFYGGQCGGKYSFCNLHGGEVSNKVEDMGGWTASYALCTMPGGQTCKDDDFAHSCQCP